jgi:hypothetical protein
LLLLSLLLLRRQFTRRFLLFHRRIRDVILRNIDEVTLFRRALFRRNSKTSGSNSSLLGG